MTQTLGAFWRVSGPVLWSAVLAVAMVLGGAGARAQSQYPMVDKLAARVIQKYQTSSCADLAARRGQPPSPMELKFVALMRDDAAMRAEFLDRVAAPIANKMFECRLIP